MTLEDAPAESVPATRRALRTRTGEMTTADTGPIAAEHPTTTDAVEPAPAAAPALAWLDARSVPVAAPAPQGIDLNSDARVDEPDLLADMPRRRAVRASVILPIVLVLLVAVGYATSALLWPLNAVPPQIAAVQVQPKAATTAAVQWPTTGSAAVGVAGIGEPVASSTKTVPMASITKLVTALLVLDEMPLSVGEPGREFVFTGSDRAIYYNFLARGESALDVPVGGTLTEYQLLEGMLIGSAGNYAQRLAGNLWPTDDVYAAAATRWLATHGLTGITVVEPTGIESANKATPEALVPLAEKALANPVIAEIVAKKSVTLPGAGKVANTNKLLADPGVVGIKTGTLDRYNLLSAKDVTVGDTAVRLYASVLGQKDEKSRLAVSRSLFAQLEQELQPVPSVTTGMTAGEVTTAWGETVKVIAAGDAAVLLWNGAAPAATIALDLGDHAARGDVVGTLTLTGPLNSATTSLRLADDIEGPSPWWRLTHPIELFGLGRG